MFGWVIAMGELERFVVYNMIDVPMTKQRSPAAATKDAARLPAFSDEASLPPFCCEVDCCMFCLPRCLCHLLDAGCWRCWVLG
mmetsp:Transcript_14005/g.19896  ORF Transcript_14005/g.19896 Transcript_14005/m.19896 type:complete len:83 (+) Transcript_14005:989-1237(+)